VTSLSDTLIVFVTYLLTYLLTVNYISVDSMVELWLKIMHMGYPALDTHSRIVCCLLHKMLRHYCPIE